MKISKSNERKLKVDIQILLNVILIKFEGKGNKIKIIKSQTCYSRCYQAMWTANTIMNMTIIDERILVKGKFFETTKKIYVELSRYVGTILNVLKMKQNT